MTDVVETKEARSGITLKDLIIIMALVSLVLAFVMTAVRPSNDRSRVREFFERASELAASSATNCVYLENGLRYEGKCFSHGPYNVFKADDTMLFSKEKFSGKTALISALDPELVAYVDARVNP